MKKLTLFLSAMLLACATSLWAETYTITFLTNSSDGSTEIKSTTQVSTVVATASTAYVTGFTANCSKAYYKGKSGVKLGSSGAAGTFEFNLADKCKSNVKKITVKSAKYSSDKGTLSLYVNGEKTALKSGIAPGTDYVHTFTTAQEVSSIKLTTSEKRAYVSSIIIEIGAPATLQTIEITEEPTKKDYMAGEAFSTEGLKVMGNYDDDTQKEITEGITWSVNPATLTAGETSVKVTATVGEKTATRTITGLTVTAAKTLTSIAVSGTPAEFWKGDPFNHNGMTVTAKWDDNSTTDVTTEATFSTPDMTTAGTKTITVTYKEKTTTYDITVKTIANTQETAYTVAEAIALIDAGKDLTSEVFVKGTISKIDGYNSTYKSITYWLDDNSFEVYSGKGLNNAGFNSKDDIAVGGEVIVYGIIKEYSGTYEFDYNNYLVYYKAPADAKKVATITLNGNKTEMESTEEDNEYTVTYNGDGELSITSSNEAVAVAIIVGTDVVVDVLAEGTTTITISASGTENYYAAETKYTLTVVPAWVAASLPFTFDGVAKDINPENGIKQSGLGSDYGSSPKLKFDHTGDVVFVRINETADTVAYTIKGNGVSGATMKFDVLQSANGIDYSPLASYTVENLPTTAKRETKTPASDARYFQFVYTEKANGNVALGAIRISKSQSTAIDNATAETPAVKMIENGQLIILRDGVKYNAMGVRLQ